MSSILTFYDLYSVIALNLPLNSTITNTTRNAGLHPSFPVTRDGTHNTNHFTTIGTLVGCVDYTCVGHKTLAGQAIARTGQLLSISHKNVKMDDIGIFVNTYE